MLTCCSLPTEHCLIGSQGHAVQEDINEALQQWGRERHANVSFVLKGINPLTEHFSAFKAEMPLTDDATTALNTPLMLQLLQYSKVLVCGEAKSHCVNYSVRDLVSFWPPERAADIVLLADAMSSVTGFEATGDEFLYDMVKAGCTVMTVDEAQQNIFSNQR
jgi:nicotinamidase/pyrazinamidase